jgi:hypothetical protein
MEAKSTAFKSHAFGHKSNCCQKCAAVAPSQTFGISIPCARPGKVGHKLNDRSIVYLKTPVNLPQRLLNQLGQAHHEHRKHGHLNHKAAVCFSKKGLDASTQLSPASEWAGIPYPNNGLSYRANRCLRRGGIPATKNQSVMPSRRERFVRANAPAATESKLMGNFVNGLA